MPAIFYKNKEDISLSIHSDKSIISIGLQHGMECISQTLDIDEVGILINELKNWYNENT